MESLLETKTALSETYFVDAFTLFRSFQGAFALQVIDGDVFPQFPASESIVFNAFHDILSQVNFQIFGNNVDDWVIAQINIMAITYKDFACSVRGGSIHFNHFDELRRFCIDFIKEHFEGVIIDTFREYSDQFVAYLAVLIHLRVQCECKDPYFFDNLLVDMEVPETLRECLLMSLLSSAAQHLEFVQNHYLSLNPQAYFRCLSDCVVRVLGVEGTKCLLVSILSHFLNGEGSTNGNPNLKSRITQSAVEPVVAVNASFMFIQLKIRALESRNPLTNQEIALRVAKSTGLPSPEVVLEIVDLNAILLARLFYPFNAQLRALCPFDIEAKNAVEKYIFRLIIPQDRGAIDSFCELFQVDPRVADLLRIGSYRHETDNLRGSVVENDGVERFFIIKGIDDLPSRLLPNDGNVESPTSLLISISGAFGFSTPLVAVEILQSLAEIINLRKVVLSNDSPRIDMLEGKDQGFDLSLLTTRERQVYDFVVVCEGNLFLYDNSLIARHLGMSVKGLLSAMARIASIIRNSTERFISVEGCVIGRQDHILLIEMRETVRLEQLAALNPTLRTIYDIVTIPDSKGQYAQERQAIEAIGISQRGKLKQIHRLLLDSKWLEEIMSNLMLCINECAQFLREDDINLISYVLEQYKLGAPLRSEQNRTVAWERISVSQGYPKTYGTRMYRRLCIVLEQEGVKV